MIEAVHRYDGYIVQSTGDGIFIAGSMRHLLLRDTRMVAARADEMLSIATEDENFFIFNLAVFFRGWATALAGRAEEGISEMQRSLSAFHKLSRLPYCWSL
jgi:hypothetical protein